MRAIKENNRLRKDVRYETLTYEFKCKQCGKSFIAYSNRKEYAYKRNGDLFCKWSCMRAWDAKHGKKEVRRYEHSSAAV